MKKLITILAIMIVLAGTVFAADQAQIKVTTDILEVEPAYKLKATSVTSGSIANGVAAVETITEQNPLTADGTVVITTNYLFDNASATVAFEVVQICTSSSYKTYTFGVTASDLKIVTYADSTQAVPHTKAFSAAHETYEIIPINGEKNQNDVLDVVLTTTNVTNLDSEGSGTTSLSRTYNGQRIVAADTDEGDVAVATFSCTWNRNLDAMPGSYEAYVTLTISGS